MRPKHQSRIFFVSEPVIRRKKTRESLFTEMKYGNEEFFSFFWNFLWNWLTFVMTVTCLNADGVENLTCYT